MRSWIYHLYSDLPVRLHAAVADGGGAHTGEGYSAVMLWYAVRAVDVAGRGYADVDLNAMAASVGRSKVTLKRYLRQGMAEADYQGEQRKKRSTGIPVDLETQAGQTLEVLRFETVKLITGIPVIKTEVSDLTTTPEEQAEKPKPEASKRLNFFRSVTRLKNGNYRIYYSSLFAVCLHMGFNHWGAVTEVKVSELKHMKAIATDAQIQRLQKCSQYLAKREHKRPTVKPEAILSSHHSRGGKSNVLHQGKQMTFVNGNFIAYGTKQTTIAESLTRSDRTIRKRLSKDFRDRHGQPEMLKTQLAQTSDALNARILSGDRDHKVFRCFGQWFEFKCNVYAELRELISMKMSRRVFNKLVAKEYKSKSVGE